MPSSNRVPWLMLGLLWGLQISLLLGLPHGVAMAQARNDVDVSRSRYQAQEVVPADGSSTHPLTVMTWNIWHGGREDGQDVGPERVVEVIRKSQADIVAMQETYGSGARISTGLRFHFLPRGTNVSIHSRHPIIEDISVFEEFKCVGGLVELPDRRRIAFYSIWLPYAKEIWAEGTRRNDQPEAMLAACQPSCDDLKKILSAINKRLAGPQYADVPVIIAGDFNSMSYLDYRSSFQESFGVSIDWPTSHVLLDAGFRDAYREVNPEVSRSLDRTWSPRFPKQQQDRIDFIYYRGRSLLPVKSFVVDSHEVQFPSDHAAVVTQFKYLPSKPDRDLSPERDLHDRRLRVVSYNIRHGQGTDRRLDLDRTAALLANVDADLIGLQEVDRQAKRSGKVDQPKQLGQRLGMQSAFGRFMDFQGGQYGMAILSRYPIVSQQEVALPEGNEPRVALACEIKTPAGNLMAVNVHFDWVKDDRFRYAQAKSVAEYLAGLKLPYVLLGDFNDQRGSRTLKLLSKNALDAVKAHEDRFTFSSTKPKIEIDFLFASPPQGWVVEDARVLRAPLTSDHRPVRVLLRRPNSSSIED